MRGAGCGGVPDRLWGPAGAGHSCPSAPISTCVRPSLHLRPCRTSALPCLPHSLLCRTRPTPQSRACPRTSPLAHRALTHVRITGVVIRRFFRRLTKLTAIRIQSAQIDPQRLPPQVGTPKWATSDIRMCLPVPTAPAICWLLQCAGALGHAAAVAAVHWRAGGYCPIGLGPASAGAGLRGPWLRGALGAVGCLCSRSSPPSCSWAVNSGEAGSDDAV